MNDPLYRPYWPYLRRVHVRRGLKIVVQATDEPIDIVTARTHLRIDAIGSPPSHPDDALITGIYLPAAREACEQYLGASLAPQTLELSIGAEDRGFYAFGTGLLQGFGLPREFELPMGPLLGIESVTYTQDGVDSSFTDFNADLFTDRVRLTQNGTWPNTDDVPNPIVIRYQAGYSTPGASPQDYQMPQALRAAILLTLSQIYDNCTQGTICDINSVPVAVTYLLDPYKRRIGFA